MAKNFIRVNGSGSGTYYTVPANKVAKVIVNHFEGTAQYWPKVGDHLVIGHSVDSLSASLNFSPSEGYLMFRYASSNDKITVFMAREHILVAGQTIEGGGSNDVKLMATVIEEDI